MVWLYGETYYGRPPSVHPLIQSKCTTNHICPKGDPYVRQWWRRGKKDVATVIYPLSGLTSYQLDRVYFIWSPPYQRTV